MGEYVKVNNELDNSTSTTTTTNYYYYNEFLSSHLLNGENLLWYEKVPCLKKIFFYSQGRLFLGLLAIFIAFFWLQRYREF